MSSWVVFVAMTGGQVLVFWCVIAGLVVIVLSELWRRWTNANVPLEPSDNRRYRAERERQP